MIERVLAFRRRPRRQRFRDRVLVGMLVVALTPLVVFTAVVAADLGAVSQATVDDTHRTILEDQEVRQRGQVADRALAIDVRLGSIADEIRQLRDQTAAALQKPPPDGLQLSFQVDNGAYYSSTGDPDTSVIVGQTSHLVHAGALDTARHTAPIAAPSAPLVTFMEGMHKNYPEIEAVWIADKTDSVIRTVPSMDVPRAIAEHRLNPGTPLGPDGDTIFSTSQARFAEAAAAPQAWSDPAKPGPQSSGPFWTDPYNTRLGDQGVTVWMPVSADGQTLVGADLTVAQITGTLLQPSISGEPGAYPLLLSSNNKVLAAGDQARADFHLATLTGSPLPLDGSSDFGQGMLAVEQTGHPETLRTSLAKVDRDFFSAPIYTAHWVLATSVPVKDMEPDVSGLTRGIQTGIHRILLHVIPIALVLCALA